MKKLFILAACALSAGLMAVSCNLTGIDLDGTTWEIVRSEDLLNGKVVNSFPDDAGTVSFIGTNEDFVITIDFDDSYAPDTYTPEDITIVRSSGAEFVFDMYYYEYDDVTKDNVEYYTTYKGTKIYKGTYLYYGKEEEYYCYFKPNGVAVDVGAYNYAGEPDIWWDCTRYYCRRVR
ncbi:MAG: hypothetical protein J5695_03050 [Bacteroidales bacterium]|nr:hypothetical protein [Bacteroidales bacterium]